MHQPKSDIEKFYQKPDPWGYLTNPDDKTRLKYLYFIPTLLNEGDFERVLDVGTGEGLLLKSFSTAKERDGIELSDTAARRLPKGVRRVYTPNGKYDLVFATGVLYEQYDYEQMRKWIEDAASHYVVTSHYDRVGIAHDKFDKKQIFYTKFPYRDGHQILRVYQW